MKKDAKAASLPRKKRTIKALCDVDNINEFDNVEIERRTVDPQAQEDEFTAYVSRLIREIETIADKLRRSATVYRDYDTEARRVHAIEAGTARILEIAGTPRMRRIVEALMRNTHRGGQQADYALDANLVHAWSMFQLAADGPLPAERTQAQFFIWHQESLGLPPLTEDEIETKKAGLRKARARLKRRGTKMPLPGGLSEAEMKRLAAWLKRQKPEPPFPE